MPEILNENFAMPIDAKASDYTIEHIWEMVCLTEGVSMWFYEWWHLYCNHPDCDEHTKFRYNPKYDYQTIIK